MRKFSTAVAFAATILAGAPAVAAPGIVWQPDVYTVPDANATILFGGYNAFPASGGGTPYTRSTTATGTVPGEVTSGLTRLFVNGTNDGSAAKDPSATDTGNFLSIGKNASYTITFATPVQFFSFIVGTIDNFNTVVLVDQSNISHTYTGRQIIGEAAAGPTNNDNLMGRVIYYFNGGPGLKSATLSSTDTAFEVDEFASAVPEPDVWAMMILGFGAVGGALRAARRRVAQAIASA